VLIGVTPESSLAHFLVELPHGLGAVLVVFAEHRETLRLQRSRGIFQILEAVGLHHEHLLEIFFGERGVIGGEIVAGESVGRCAGVLQGLFILCLWNLLGATKHHVLEQVREAGFAGLDLIARTGLHHDIEGNDIRVVGRDGNQPQPVGKIFL
jgi:hypothetical protein